jgi:hypothetical protein
MHSKKTPVILENQDSEDEYDEWGLEKDEWGLKQE